MIPVINLGPLSLPAPQLILIIGLWLGASLAERQVKKAGRKSEILFKIIWTAVLAGVLGARLSFVARNPSAFQGQWISIFSLNQSLLDPAGGLMIASVAGYFVALKYRQSSWALLDDLVPFLAVLAPALFLSNFASGSGYGTITDLPWGIDLWGGLRHPVQLYYMVASLVVLILAISRNRLKQQIAGAFMLSFIVLTSGYLTVFSAFQDPAGNLIAGFRVIQLIYWMLFTSSIFTYNNLTIRGSENASG